MIAREAKRSLGNTNSHQTCRTAEAAGRSGGRSADLLPPVWSPLRDLPRRRRPRRQCRSRSHPVWAASPRSNSSKPIRTRAMSPPRYPVLELTVSMAARCWASTSSRITSHNYLVDATGAKAKYNFADLVTREPLDVFLMPPGWTPRFRHRNRRILSLIFASRANDLRFRQQADRRQVVRFTV